ncbi:MAG TPA: sigma-70 family RNA polymerase sigma factor [Pseudonocardiaceae bacterium]|jgi:RNA polymerase sigma-70 factor (ECF subfamily)
MGDARHGDAQITSLALAAGAGDRVALAAFIRGTQRDVHRFLAHRSDHDQAEDLTQETYLRALRALPRFAGRASARTWLLSIARRVAADQVRQAVVRPRTTAVEDWEALVADRAGQRRSGFDEGVVLRELVAGLETDRRDAFVLTQVLDLSYAEAAEVCGCPVGTIRSRVARAREDLVRELNSTGRPGRSATGP